MAGATIEIFPKTRFDRAAGSESFKQSTAQAIDTGGYNFLSLQVWVYHLTGGGSPDTLAVDIEEATVNEDDAFVPAVTPTTSPIITFTGNGSTQTQIVHLNVFSRFIRLTVTPTLAAAGQIVDVRAHANLKLVPGAGGGA